MFEGFMIGIVNAIQSLMSIFPSVISWLNQPLKLGFSLFGEGFNLFGWDGYIGLNLGSPLSLIGVGALVLIGLWAVKKLVPFL